MILGLISFAAAGYLYVREIQFLSRAESVMGTVKTLETAETDDGGTSYCPLIEFTTLSGQLTIYNPLVCGDPPPYEVGEQVKVFYDPQPFGSIQVDNFWSKYVWSFTAGMVGMAFLLVNLIDSKVRNFIQKLKNGRSVQ